MITQIEIGEKMENRKKCSQCILKYAVIKSYKNDRSFWG